MTAKIEKSTFTFLKDLAKNNNREWFDEHKPKYKEAQQNAKDFCAALVEKLNKHDAIEDYKVYRIYRDIRFSKDKTPYKKNIGCGFSRLGADRRGGCYLNIEPGNSFVGGGFWGPSPKDLLRIRKEIEMNAEPLRKIIAAPVFQKHFGGLEGAQVKTSPKGFSKDHEAIDLLRYKQYLVMRRFSDKETMSANFLEEVDQTFQAMRPFFDFMTETLTTDVNGSPLI